MSLVLALALVTIGPAPVRPAIRWEAPAACPSQAAFLARIPGLHDPGTRWADVSAHARVRVLDEGFGLELTLRSASGSSTRHARATACEPLADAAALILATFVEPVATAQRLDAPHAGDAPPHARPTAPGHDAAAPHARIRELQPCPPATPAPRAPTPRAPDRFGVRVGGQAGRASLPGLDVGPLLALGWRRGLLHLDALALALLPRRRSLEPQRPEVGLRLWTLGGGLTASVVMPVADRVELPIGLGLEATAMVARGEGIAHPRTVLRPWVAALGLVHLVWRPRPAWGLWAGAATVVGLVRPAFTVSDLGPLTAGLGGLRAMLGVEWRWPRWPR